MARNYQTFVSSSPGAGSDLDAPINRRVFFVRYLCFVVAGLALGYLLDFLILLIAAQLWPTVEARGTNAYRMYNLLTWIPFLAFVFLSIRLLNRWLIRPRLQDAGENVRISWMSYFPVLFIFPLILCLAKPTKTA